MARDVDPTLCHPHGGTNMKLSNAAPSTTDRCIIIIFFLWTCESKQFISCIVLFPVGSGLILRGQLYIQRMWFIHVAAECGGETPHSSIYI